MKRLSSGAGLGQGWFVASRTPPAYKWLDTITGVLLLFQIVWAPWAFGSTTAWAVWTLNIVGYVLGAVYLVKRWTCRMSEYEPQRWGAGKGGWLGRLLAGLMILLILYVLTSALNWRARVELSHEGPIMTYRDGHIPWLPHSYDANQTWKGFFRYVGLMASFWAARDWLMTRARSERRKSREMAPESESESAFEGGVVGVFPPIRLQWLLWTLILSSAVMAIVGITQRLDGEEKLLWVRQTPIRQANASQFAFGPFGYRGNATQYFNLVWPLAIGFWWTLRVKYQRRAGIGARTGGDPSMVLLPLAALLAAVPVLAGSRGGFLILVLQLAAVVVLLVLGTRRASWGVRLTLGGALLGGLALGAYTGGDLMLERFEKRGISDLTGRELLWENAGRMAKDFPVFGSGAETYPTLNYLYRKDVKDRWEGYVHDDYLETRLSLGWVGFVLVLCLLGAALLMGLFQSGIPAPPSFCAFLWISIGGLLVHARFDFPMQVVGILFTFMVLVVLLGASSPRSVKRNAMELGAERPE